ncbi:hypothetical protein [Corallococcus sp. EGB]|uniref:hypothetical protein n=1 Tax=Corallococcus sp. EGB TaxID=1521117 RepID=UPI001CC1A64C|nr:hypothetical protein [Corallococcus sp. EGB]
MLSALYYPYMSIGSRDVLKNALLLWDKVEVIVPSLYVSLRRFERTWPSESKEEIKLLREAEDLVVSPRIPTGEEQVKAHKALEEMANTGELAALAQKKLPEENGVLFSVDSDKFLHETWDMLRRRKIVHWSGLRRDREVPPAIGLLLMSVLSDICAGTQIQMITDHAEAYAWLAKQRAGILGSQYVTGVNLCQVEPELDRLVALSLGVVGGQNIGLRELVDMRKREANGRTGDYRAMRHRYSKTLAAHVARIMKEARSEADLQELDRQFRDDVEQDFSDLMCELKVAGRNTLISGSVIVSTILAKGGVTEPIDGLAALALRVGVGIIPLVGAWNHYRGARRDVLKKHTMSWLFVAKQRLVCKF